MERIEAEVLYKTIPVISEEEYAPRRLGSAPVQEPVNYAEQPQPMRLGSAPVQEPVNYAEQSQPMMFMNKSPLVINRLKEV